MIIPPSDLKTLVELHQKSLHFQSYQLARKFGNFTEWEGTDALLEAANIAHNLGAVELSNKLASKAWRNDKTNVRAIFAFANDLFHLKGALPCLIFIRKHGQNYRSEAKHQSWWYSLNAEIFAALRDFKTADLWHQKAVDTAPDETWALVSRAHSLELQDRYEEALKVSRKAFEMDGGQRSSAYQTAHLLTLLERFDEALEILTSASERLENAWIMRQLADLQTELGMHEAAFSSLERMLELTPFREKKLDDWIYGSLSNAAYLMGDVEKAVEFSEKSAHPFHQKIKENLTNLKGNEKRVKLKLGFLRQHHFTCAPATLSNIGRFWEKKAEHLEIAEEMCYDGTPAYKERLWAEKNGWETREFTINWNDTAKLIDRGVPFTLATINPGNGHLQAVIGYDEKRKTFLIRDPFYHHFDEYLADELLENQKSNGPRGLALVPREKAELLQDLNLAESRVYDLQFAVESALEINDWEKAAESLAQMEKEFPEHRLTWSARWTLARYDANNLKLLEAVENLLKQFPEDVNLKLSYLSVSHEFTSRAERLKKLEEFAKDKNKEPLFREMFGYELGADAHQHKRALHWLYKAVRAMPASGMPYRYIADILWSQRRFEEAVELYRFAACLNDKEENFSYSYFLAMRFLKKEEEALQFLRDRYERFGHRSNMPVRSLFHALRELGRTVEAFEILDNALLKRPEDGELKLFAAELKSAFGQKEEAEKLLHQAENQAPQSIWLRNAAIIAEKNGDLQKALEFWRKAVVQEPTSPEIHERTAFLLSATEGRKASQDYLRKVTRQFPFNLELQKLRLTYLREETTEAIAVVRDLVRMNPQDTWSRRELARWLCLVKKFDKALENAAEAVRIDPNDSANHWSVGMVLAEMNNFAEAAKSFEKAVSLSVEAEYAFNSWMSICRTNEEKLAVLRFMSGELRTQINFGYGVSAYREHAKRLLEPKVLLEELKEFSKANQDQWFALSVVVQQLGDMYELDEARELAEKNTKRFPLVYQVWYDLSMVYKLKGEHRKEVEALRQAVTLNANWSFGFQQLSEALQRVGEFEESRNVLKDAVIRMPFDYILHGYLAEAQWKTGEKQAALETARKAVSIEPDYDWAWHVIKSWSEELDQPDLAVKMARELTLKKPKDARTWITYAQILESGQFSQEQLDAVEEALKLEPQNTLALAVKANCLADARRFDEAIKVCQTVSAEGIRPDRLRYVQAGIEAGRGNYIESVEQLESLTKDSPDYYPAFERLAGIYRDWREKRVAYLRVTQAMTRLAPQEPIAFGYLGEAYLSNNKREDAKKAFRQALIISPEYSYAGVSLFDLYFEDGETEKCRSIVKLLEQFVHNENSLIREIVFRAKDEDWETAGKLWRELCLNEKANNFHFAFVLDKFKSMQLHKQAFVLEVLRETSFEPNVNPFVGIFFVERCLQTKSEKDCLEYLENLPSNSSIWAKATGKYLEKLIDRNDRSLNEFVKANAQKLKQNDDAWASVGYALNASRQYNDGLNWFADWEQREKIEPWMLWNYTIILRRLNNIAEANRVHQAALNLTKQDETVSHHLMMLGLEAVYAGNYQAAQEFYGQINPTVMQEWDKFFYFLLSVGLEIHRFSAEGNADQAKEATKNMVNDALLEKFWNDNVMNDNFDRSLKAALALNSNLWLSFSLHTKVFFAKMSG